MNANPQSHYKAGFLTALTTPFTASGKIDGKAVSALVQNAKNLGLDGLYVGGSTGEGFLLSPEIRAELFESVAEAADGSLKLIAQVGAIEVAHAERNAVSAAKAGFHEVSSTPPIYFKHTLAEMKDYYRDLQSACDLPMVLYNIPALTGVSLPNQFFFDLSEDMNISGIKYTSTDIIQLVGLLDGLKDVPVYYGVDEMLVAGLSVGSHGGIGSTYNILGREYRELAEYLASGNLSAADELQARANRFIDVLVSVGMPTALKACLEIRGLCSARPMRPFHAVSKDDMKRLEVALEKLDQK
ncbi:N-acetylneuraminate lyase [Litoreibacter ascidiaceicola]|uniref:N-acetylneuraminate lyase n=1 Tax=Litoreibacter ascidiaceicola TaxID=1486859 RepID=A0A1M5DML2_9RHOB|nr:dihydrodipicolinate synthase family protein [Litoreibacter ascidiaceicola]SHF65489.1 N-acetylneuraminate lyase [Litoreibacter ascidiaceicola]SHF68022.1 N-acetylneuraminate lyase [Litoreibacter ascidiaceicola]